METNGITIPDAGTTVQYIPDPIGGWVYAVTTTVNVEQQRLGDFKAKIDDAQKRADDALAEVAVLKSHEPTLISLLKDFVADVLPSSPASTTPNKI